MTSVTEFVKWFDVEGFDVLARGERMGSVVGVDREPPEGKAILVDLEWAGGRRRIAVPLEAVSEVDGTARTVTLPVRPETLASAPAYDPVREAPDDAYLARMRRHLAARR